MTRPARANARTLGLSALLVLLSFAVYGRALWHGFTWWDDQDTIFLNPSFRPPTAASVLGHWARLPDETYYYNPLVYTVWGALAAVAYDPSVAATTPERALAAWPFHFACVLVHGLTGAATFLLLRRLLARGNGGDSGVDGPALIGAVAFVVHPVQAETVAWASGFKDLMCGLMTVLAVHEWVAASDPDEPPSAHRWPRYVTATLYFVLAILSKPLGVVVPLIAGLVDWAAHRRRPRDVIRRLVPWLLVSAAAAAFAKAFLPASVVPRPVPWERPLLAGDALAFYVYRVLAPWGFAPDYGRRPMDVLASPWAYAAWVVPVALAAACAIAWRRGHRLPAVGFAVFVVGVAPVVGLVPFDFQYYSTVADHYLYVSMLGVAVVVAGVAARLWTRGRLARGTPIAILLVWAVSAFVQAGHWKDDLALWSHTVRVNPRSFAGYSQLGFAHDRAGRVDDSIAAYRAAIRLNPDHPNAHDVWIHYARRGEFDAAARELEQYIAAAEKLPPLRRRIVPMLHNYRGEMLLMQGRLEEAAVAFERALAMDPGLTVAQKNLERVRALAAPRPAP
jgi:protein O-mannosyl-transferase